MKIWHTYRIDPIGKNFVAMIVRTWSHPKTQGEKIVWMETFSTREDAITATQHEMESYEEKLKIAA
jgi:hypothetical protein